MGYASKSKAYRVFNKRTLVIEESVHVTFDESNSTMTSEINDEEIGLEFPMQKLNIDDSIFLEKEEN